MSPYLGFEAATPGAYGRLVIEDDSLTAIVEAKEGDAGATRDHRLQFRGDRDGCGPGCSGSSLG